MEEPDRGSPIGVSVGLKGENHRALEDGFLRSHDPVDRDYLLELVQNIKVISVAPPILSRSGLPLDALSRGDLPGTLALREEEPWVNLRMAEIIASFAELSMVQGRSEDSLQLYLAASKLYAFQFIGQDISDECINDHFISSQLGDAHESSVVKSYCDVLLHTAQCAQHDHLLFALKCLEEVIARSSCIGLWDYRQEAIKRFIAFGRINAVSEGFLVAQDINRDTATSFLDKGRISFSNSEFREADKFFRQSLSYARLAGDIQIEMSSLCNLATTLRLSPDNLLEASDLYRQFLSLCRIKDVPRNIVLNYQIQAFYELAKCLQGINLLERAIFVAEKVCNLAVDGTNKAKLQDFKQSLIASKVAK